MLTPPHLLLTLAHLLLTHQVLASHSLLPNQVLNCCCYQVLTLAHVLLTQLLVGWPVGQKKPIKEI